MDGHVLIHADNEDYGLYLQSLVSQMGLDAKVVTGQSFKPQCGLVPRPLLMVLEVKDKVPAWVHNGGGAENCPVVVVSKTPVSGPFENLTRPLRPSQFTALVRRRLFSAENSKLPLVCEPFLLGNAASIVEIRKMIARASPTDVTVLLSGETGTGKGLIAQCLHNNSPRRSGPFLEVNCSSIPSSLLESELFGYRKGAFTGAFQDKPGKFDLAHSGTIFLDEISEMSRSMQAKLLQVLQEGEYSPIGGVENTKVNVRVISATNANLEQMISEGRFRADLYFRLNVIHIHLPPLRERREDIGLLKEYFLEKYQLLYEQRPVKLSREFCDLLQDYNWPGNVRELENTIKSAVALGSEHPALEDLRRKVQRPFRLARSMSSKSEHLHELRTSSLKEICLRVAEKAERAAITEALYRCYGNKKAAARLLDVSYKSLLSKIRDYGL